MNLSFFLGDITQEILVRGIVLVFVGALDENNG